MNSPIHLVQIKNSINRCVALVNEPNLQLLKFSSIYQLAHQALNSGVTIEQLVEENLTGESVIYDDVYNGKSEWSLLPSFDVPDNPTLCVVAGTGLTHKNSALSRQAMHQSDEKPSDSIIMYQWGVEGGHPAADEIGVQAEWFYKGCGTVLRGHGEALHVPPFGNDGGEEPEVAGVYIIGKDSKPYRIGYTTGNEFSDHVMEKKNYLYLAPSKLRECSIGPELVISDDFSSFTGRVSVERGNEVLFESKTNSGQGNMAHSLANLEYHHFKYEGHRIPMQAHVHYFGADAFSYSTKLLLQQDDVMTVQWDQLGRALKNPIAIASEKEALITVSALK